MPHLATYAVDAWPAAAAARALRPRFVFGHEVTSYGVATALCRGVPKILFPWGGDVFTYAESSPYHFALVKFSLRMVDLIMPSSTTAARHISERFGIRPEKVQPVSWGVDRDKFKRAGAGQRKAICCRWGISPDATVFLNVRRFRPTWGGFVALEAFIQFASEQQSAHFILMGGRGSEEFTQQARRRLEADGLISRFTLLEGDTPLDVCAELMSISDAFLSLLGRADMRSASVLQAAASGGVPIISDLPEYHEMERLGFAALFVRPDSVEDVLGALRFCSENPDKLREMRERNARYLSEYEDYAKQMEKMLALIEGVCARYAGDESARRTSVANFNVWTW